MENIQITEWYRLFLRRQVRPGDLCIDATMGNGSDTLLLCQLAGEQGFCASFDIQENALSNTRKLLEAHHIPEHSYALRKESHEYLNRYFEPDSVNCIVFNLGYLPGGDHRLSTHAASTLTALKQSLTLLKKGGLLSVCIYSGGDSGFEERNAVLGWLKSLNPKRYLVIVSEYYNRPNHPPIPALVVKL